MEFPKNMTSILLFISVLLLLLYPTYESMSSGGIKCPPPGKGGVIDCNSIDIQDTKKRKLACDTLKQHCDVIASSEIPLPEMIIPINF